MEKKVILFAVLNWGLGHASRSVPLIKYLQKKGYQLIVCTDGHVISFLEKELQDVIYEFLPAYNISYRYSSMAINMAFQLPKIYTTYRKEKKVFSQLVKKYKPVLTISDNRYGCIKEGVPSYFIGHQWNILQSANKTSRLASFVNQHFIHIFHGFLIPDRKENSLSGKLTTNISHPNTKWLGITSRFSKLLQDDSKTKTFEFLAILSGPEPARTNLEEKLIDYCRSKPSQQFAIVRGTELVVDYKFPPNCLCFNIVEKRKLVELILGSKAIISRSGYSSVMDYCSMGLKNILFIPTPGQTEQEYLAERLEQKGFLHLQENKLANASLDKALNLIFKRDMIQLDVEVPMEFETVLDSILQEVES